MLRPTIVQRRILGGNPRDRRACCRPWLGRIPSCAFRLLCGDGQEFYPELFRKTPQAEAAVLLSERVFEFSSFLVDQLGVTELGSRFPAKVTFHDGCHGLRELHVKQQPRRLLERVKDFTLVQGCEAGGHPRFF